MRNISKLLFVLFIFHISNEQTDMNIEILGGEKSPKCSSDVGKMEFSLEYTSSSQEELNSYFLLYFKDSSNKKRFSICSLSKNSTHTEPISSTDISEPSTEESIPSETEPTPSQTGPTPSQTEPKPSQTEPKPSKPSENETEPKTDENTEEHNPDDTELKTALESLILKYQKRLNSGEFKNVVSFIKEIIRYQIVTQTKKINFTNFNGIIKSKLNNSLNKLFDIGSRNFQQASNFNTTEVINKINSSVIYLKKQITKNIEKQQYLFKEWNYSDFIDAFTFLFSESSKSSINEKIIDKMDKLMTKFNSHIIQSLKNIENANKKYDNNTNLKDIMDILKIKIQNKSNIFQSKLKNITDILDGKINKTKLNIMNNILTNRINETLYNLPNVLKNKAEKKELLIIFDKVVNYLNSSKLNNPKIISILQKLENLKKVNVTNVLLTDKEKYIKTFNEIKIKVNSLNDTTLNKLMEKLEELNNKILKSLNELNIPEYMQKINNNFKSFINSTENKIQENALTINKIIISSLEKINKANTTELTNILLGQVGINSKIISLFNNETKFLIKNKLNITGHLKDYINNHDDLGQLIEEIRSNDMKIISILSTPEILKAIEDLKNYKEIMKQSLQNAITERKNVLNQTLYELIDKIVKTNYTIITETLSNKNTQILKMINELKQSTNKTDMDSVVLKMRKIIENNYNLLNISKFSTIYYDYLSKINNVQTTLLSLTVFEKLKENNVSLANIQDEIKNITTQIKEKLSQSNVTDLLKDNLDKINEFNKNKISNINKDEILKNLTKLQNLLKNTTLYSKVEPLLKQLETKNKELITIFNETGVIEQFMNAITSFNNTKYLLKNETEFLATLNAKMSQIDFANLMIRLNETLTEIKDDIIKDMRNETNFKEKKNELRNNFNDILKILKNSINFTEILQNINNLFPNNSMEKKILGKLINHSSHMQALKNRINISEIINTTIVKSIFSNLSESLNENIKKNIDKTDEQLKTVFLAINESLYNYENNFILTAASYLQNASKVAKDKLKDAKIGDLNKLFKENINSTIELVKNKIQDKKIPISMQHINLIKEIFSPALKRIQQKMSESKELFNDINKVKDAIYKINNKIIELPFIKDFINKTSPINEILKDIKLSEIQEYLNNSKQVLTEEFYSTKNISGRLKYLFNQYNERNNKTELKLFVKYNKTRINERIEEFISFVGKIETYFSQPDLLTTYNKTEWQDQIIRLNKTISEDFDEIKNLLKLVQKKYENLPDNYNKTELAQKIMALLREEKDKFNISIPIEEYLSKVTVVLKSLEYTIPENKTELSELLNKQVNVLENVGNETKNLLDSMTKKTDIKDMFEGLNEKAKNQLKKTLKNLLQKMLVSKNINNIQNNELIKKMIEKLSNNTIIGSQFSSQILKFTLFINKLNASVFSDDDNEYLDLIRNYPQNVNIKNTLSEINNRIYENGFNFDEFIDIYKNIKSLIAEISNQIKSLPQIYNIYTKIIKPKLSSINNKISEFKNNKRRADDTQSLTCKLEGDFSENEVLTANPENINSLILKSSSNYNMMIKSDINIKIDKDTANKCGNNNVENISKNINFKTVSTLKIEHTKKRFNFKMRVQILPTFRIPPFFYLWIKVKIIIKAKHLRFLDTEEEVDSFCLLENEADKDDALFNCLGYNDNINENNANNEINIGDFSSDYIKLPENLSITNEPEPEDTTENNTVYNNRIFSKSRSSGLSTGAIIGIIIPCVAILAIVSAIILCLKKKSNGPNSYGASESGNDLKISNSN